MKIVEVRLVSQSYNIRIGSGLLADLGRCLAEIGFSGKLVIITDTTVKNLYERAVCQHLASAGFETAILEVAEGEEQKSLECAGRLYQGLSDLHAERTTPILALGGGVIGDLAGFVAATYLRGVPLVQVPTTLLAQVDSSIGGKVALDHGRLKNKIGAFYQPGLVLSDINTLTTLPAREFSQGLAEVIKYAVIRDEAFFDYLETHMDRILSLYRGTVEEIVFRSARIKAEIVEKDERDSGLRNILNYGHTVGHAIESASDYGIGHGQAVALGMLAAGRIASKLGIFDKTGLHRLKVLIQRAGLPTDMPDLDVARIVQAIALDKKVLQGRIRFVLPRAIGNVFITDEVSPDQVVEIITGWHDET